MQIKVLYFNGCPNWQTAAKRVGRVLAELGRPDVTVRVEDVHHAPHLSSEWAGSPTILVDGRDPFSAAADGLSADPAIDSGRHPVLGRDACRIYVTEAGFEGAPSLDQLRIALNARARIATQHAEELMAMSPIETETTVQDVARAISAATIDIGDKGRSIVIAVYDLLAQGDPVTPAKIAAHSGKPLELVVATLKGWPGVFWDDEGRVVGFWGLAIPEMDHRFHAENGKPMYAWCALDPFLIVPVIRRPARVESKDPVTGEIITMTVTPEGITDLAPASAVVSFIAPDRPFDFDVMESFCHNVLNFASPESADRWASERSGIVLLPAAQAFEVGLRAWSRWHPETPAEGQATA